MEFTALTALGGGDCGQMITAAASRLYRYRKGWMSAPGPSRQIGAAWVCPVIGLTRDPQPTQKSALLTYVRHSGASLAVALLETSPGNVCGEYN
jgi:hypothetical protein